MLEASHWESGMAG